MSEQIREQIKQLFCKWCVVGEGCKELSAERKLDCCEATGFVNEFEHLGYRPPAKLSLTDDANKPTYLETLGKIRKVLINAGVDVDSW